MIVVSAVVVGYLLVDAVVRGGIATALLLAPWPLLALWGVYLTAFCSALTVDEDGALVQNMMRRVHIPWERVRELDWRWQVEFTLDDDTRVRAIGGPAQGRSARRPGRADLTPASARAQYDYIVRLRERAVVPQDDPVRAVRRGWDAASLTVLGVLVIWAIIAVVVTGGPS